MEPHMFENYFASGELASPVVFLQNHLFANIAKKQNYSCKAFQGVRNICRLSNIAG